MKVLFIAPTSQKLDLSEDLAAVGNGNEIEEVANGLIDRSSVERLLRSSKAELLYLASDGLHGVLQLNGELLDENDLVQMMADMRQLRYVVINACNSLGIGSAIHNRFHTPVACMEMTIGDKAAHQFARTLFSALRNKETFKAAFEAARMTVARLYPNDAYSPRLINGDDVTAAQLGDCMTFVKAEIGEMRQQLNAIEADVREMKDQRPSALVITALVLLALAAIGQWVQPWLAAAVAR